MALAQLREVIREEVRAELARTLSPTFVETITRAQAEMTKIFDYVIEVQGELADMKTSLRILEGAVEALQGSAIAKT